MAREALSDYLQTHTFWLVDVAPILPLSLPIFDPFAGFKTCTAPEVSLDFETIKEGNWIFDKKVVKSGNASPITLERGVTFSDSDFWRWVITALTGDMGRISSGTSLPLVNYGGPTYRRDLLLFHFFNRMFDDGLVLNFLANGDTSAAGKTEAALLAAAGVGLGSGLITGTAAAAQLGVTALLSSFEFAPRIPARAYYLHGCTPSRYKVGSDFDAMSADVSIAELELQVEMVEVMTLGF